jgi:Uncharacterized protein conserved in bacteria (DUF2188)
MSRIAYEVVEHDGGWAYRANGTFSETFPTRQLAHEAAMRVAGEQRVPGSDAGISYEDEKGKWRAELSAANDRPKTEVED